MREGKNVFYRLSLVSLSVFSLVSDRLFDRWRVPEYAKIWTVLQSNQLSSAQIWTVTRHQYGIMAIVPQTLYGGETRGGVS